VSSGLDTKLQQKQEVGKLELPRCAVNAFGAEVEIVWKGKIVAIQYDVSDEELNA